MTLRIVDRGLKNPDELKVFGTVEGVENRERWDWDMSTIDLGFLMIPMGIPRITEENAYEVLRRIRAMETFGGPLGRDGIGRPIPYPEDDLIRRIGLATNATPITRVKFDTWVKKNQDQANKEA
jgi:hypothetical protein